MMNIYLLEYEPTQKIHQQQQKHRIQRYPPLQYLSNDHKDRPNQHKNSHKQWGASRCEHDGKSMETDTTTWSEFPKQGKAIVERILVLEELNKCKRAGLRESQSVIWVGELNI